MCGIAGLLRLSERPLPGPEVIARMRRALAHRGPDEHGTFIDDHVALTMARLSVIDPAHGHQPVHGCAGSGLTAVYNGEIYNHLELRPALESNGHALPNHCDSALLPHLFEEHGPPFLERLRGMFALALWDARRRRLFLARDRLGIKPLYLARTPEFLIFASEIKGILASGLVSAALDRDSIDDLFSLGWPCPPRTMFSGIEELPPAHWLEIGPGTPQTRHRWWQVRFPHRGEHLRDSPRALASRYRDALQEAVQLHLRSDVPVGVYLSGGLDSSAIAALAQRASGAAPLTLSIGFEDQQYDESRHAAAVRAALGSRGHVFRSSATTAEAYPRALWHTELPLLVPVATSGIELSAGARSAGIPVVLTGDGADEVFGGYDGFRADRMRRLLSRPWLSWLKPAVYRQLYKWARAPSGAVEFMLQVQSRGQAEIERAFGGVYPPWYDFWQLLDLERAALLGTGGRRVRPTTEAPSGWSALVPADVDRLDPLDALIAVEQATRLPGWILTISDRCSMAHGVEARVPFLDHELVELAAQLPPNLKMRGFQEKALLREAMRGVLPTAIRKRRKQPFVTPIRRWFFEDGAPGYVRDLLTPEALESVGVFDPATVSRLRARLGGLPGGTLESGRHELILMLVVGVQLLHRLFIARFEVDGPAPIRPPSLASPALRGS